MSLSISVCLRSRYPIAEGSDILDQSRAVTYNDKPLRLFARERSKIAIGLVQMLER